ncbi:MAG: archease [Ignavibacteriaceae bacterium]|nr:archease [Ignavibacteriaceae bacterium]
MASHHKFIDHTADIAVEVTADSFEELLTESLSAYNEAVLDSENIQVVEEQELQLQASGREQLLVSFLNEINFLLTVKKWISKSIEKISITSENDFYKLNCITKGFYIKDGIKLKEEIKSVTYHQMEIVEEKGVFKTRIVFDI